MKVLIKFNKPKIITTKYGEANFSQTVVNNVVKIELIGKTEEYVLTLDNEEVIKVKSHEIFEITSYSRNY